jgi:hypothetical protein
VLATFKTTVHPGEIEDFRSLYVLIVSLLATVISLPAVWFFVAAAYAAPALVA